MEAVPFETLVKTYLEIGILGLTAIIFLFIAIIVIKKFIKGVDKKDEKIAKKDEQIVEVYEKLLNYQKELFNTMTDNIIKGVTVHTPSCKENKKLTEVHHQLDLVLQDILLDTKATRVCIIQYHNGGRGINKQSFLKMSITNEKMSLGEQPLMPAFKDQFRSVLSYIVNTLEHQNTLYIEDLETLKELDYGSYDFYKIRNIKQVFFRAIHNASGMVIGFIQICYGHKNTHKGDSKVINEELNTKYDAIERLLTIDAIE